MKKPKKRKDGRYQIGVSLGTDANGKRIQKIVCDADWEECQRKAEALKVRYGKGLKVDTLTASFSKILSMFLEIEKGQNKPAIVKTKKFRAEFFCPYFGNTPIAEVKPFQIQLALQALAAENKAEKTIKEYFAVLRQVFDFAIQNGIIDSSPVPRVRVPDGKPPEKRRALSPEERKQIQALPQSQEKTVAMLGLFAGLRRGEIAALKWSDVDFVKGEISVSVSYDFKHREFKQPKTAAGCRTVPLFKPLEVYLRSLPRTHIRVAGNLLTEKSWDRVHVNTFRMLEERFGNPERLTVRVGSNYFFNTSLPVWTYHELRHTFCTILYESGCPVAEAAAILGHAQISTTQEIYTHLTAERKSEIFTKLKAVIN